MESRNKNKLIVAAAGSGKTTFLINAALKLANERVLITTFTEANEAEIIQRFVNINKCVPANVTIQTWFSFLLQHGARPYQGVLFESNINGLVLEGGQSVQGVPESNTRRHFFTNSGKIYSDKLAKFVVRCNENSNGEVVGRISRIFDSIFIDEVQDLAGYDLEILKQLFKNPVNVLLVGDPRQGTYSTNNSAKNKKFKKSGIVNFFDDKTVAIEKVDSLLITNYRCIEPICTFSNRLFPNFTPAVSGNNSRTGHDGVFLVRSRDLAIYLSTYQPIQLRDSVRTKIKDSELSVFNFGKSKGLEFDRVIIYPTAPIIEWIEDENVELAPTSRSKFYVALTRARYSVAIVYDFDEGFSRPGLSVFLP